MGSRMISRALIGSLLLGASVAGFAQTGWVPGSEITGQSIQVETSGVTNTVYFDPGGVARIQTPAGATVPATWNVANGQLCLSTGSARECWPYTQPFQAGQQLSLTSSCQSASRWLPLSVGQAPQAQASPERG
jgi:hypothetical protein